MKFSKKMMGLCPAIILSIMLASCGGQATAGANNESTNASAQTSIAASTENGAENGDNGQPGNGDFKQADLYGEVKSVSGSEITLALMEMQQPGNGDKPQGDGQNAPANGDKQQGDAQKTPEGTASSDEKSNGDGKGNPPSGNDGKTMEKNYTGESTTITLPSDVKINSFGRSQDGNEESAKTIADITVGSIIQVYYKDAATKEIESISIMPTGMGDGQKPGNDQAKPEESTTQKAS